MLDETQQLKLARITPQGTNITQKQKNIRKKIQVQKERLASIHKKTLGEHNSIINYEFIKKSLENWGIVRFGVSPILEGYTYKNAKLNPLETRVIVFVISMKYQKMENVPSIESATEILNTYFKVGEVVIKLTKILREKGILATGHHPLGDIDDYHHLLFPAYAVEAGLGEKGRTGLFIDHQLGSLVRIGMVSAALSLRFDQRIDRGVNEFCHRCRFCVNFCPPRAINPGNYLESSRLTQPIIFKIDGKKCIKYFEKHHGCGICQLKCVLANPVNIKKRLARIKHWYNTWIISGELAKLHQKI